MKKFIALPLLVFALALAGCNSQPQPSYTYVQTQPQPAAQPVQADIDAVQVGGQAVVNRACLDNMNRVVDDRYCDQAWIAQQQAIAQQNHDTALLNSLLLYHAMYGGSVYNGYYNGGVAVLPSGYIYRPYGVYVHDYASRPIVHKHVTVNNITNVTNTSTTVNKTAAPASSSTTAPKTASAPAPASAPAAPKSAMFPQAKAQASAPAPAPAKTSSAAYPSAKFSLGSSSKSSSFPSRSGKR